LKRFYRAWCDNQKLVNFTLKVKESDLYIRSQKDLTSEALESLQRHRRVLEEYIAQNPDFKTTLTPLPIDENVPELIHQMLLAARAVGVGPMAGVAGAIAEFVGRDLLKYSQEVIVENGGDIFIKSSGSQKIGIYAGSSFFTKRLVLEINSAQTPLGIATSSGTVGHSLSFGTADAVTIVASSAVLADATATAVGNRIINEDSLKQGIEFSQRVEGVKAAVIIKNDRVALWGEIKVRCFEN
jgi:hypothetical protein